MNRALPRRNDLYEFASHPSQDFQSKSKMKIVARGTKTGLRPFEDPLTDAEIARVYGWSSDPKILQWSGGTPLDLTLTGFAERIRRESLDPPSDRRMFFIMTNDGELIGRIGCFALDQRAREGELGIVIGEPAFWDKGFGRDAIATLLRFLFETTPLERINLYTYPENIRAQKSFAACGFRPLGTARRFSSDLGEFTGLEMEITRAEILTRVNPNAFQISLTQGQP
jgi:RimJ/RimL family protein N-acetyltransferase